MLAFVLSLWLVVISVDSRAFRDGDVKLVDGRSKMEGTVMVFRGYGWGYICDDHWSMKEATIVCRQLGMEKAISIYAKNYFQTYGLGSYLMDDVYCNGNESRISECTFNGWGIHDCRTDELVGVQCSSNAIPLENPKLNPFNLAVSSEKLKEMRQNKFQIHLQNQPGKSGTYIVLVTMNMMTYPLCPHNFNGPEGNVLCKQNSKGSGGIIKKIPVLNTNFTASKYLARVGRCYGNETSIYECLTYADQSGVPCDSKEMIVINCTNALPDIRADVGELERSSYLDRLHLWHLKCALSENCLPHSIYDIIEKHPNSHAWITRNLLRFSSIIENVGNASFLPLEHPDQWEWHGCHLHYHSMKIFTEYQVMSKIGRKIASGHKASFCLEDNSCSEGFTPTFRCSNSADFKGTQGISPGCKDNYFHDYDCQWVDLSDIPHGTYNFQLILNPEFLVAESNYFNNAVRCTLFYPGYFALLRSCSWKHPYEL